ncbi:MAG: hypothetical protein DRP09_18525 [Candidatus Thorarchaeota archaeon]|nr:MAG: hypothetical protein DRP09_18525 [Candidatus Thorarchaeota archaeon]
MHESLTLIETVRQCRNGISSAVPFSHIACGTLHPDIEGQLNSPEKQVLAIHERFEAVERMLGDLEKRVERAVTAQSIRDEWDGFA